MTESLPYRFLRRQLCKGCGHRGKLHGDYGCLSNGDNRSDLSICPCKRRYDDILK